ERKPIEGPWELSVFRFELLRASGACVLRAFPGHGTGHSDVRSDKGDVFDDTDRLPGGAGTAGRLSVGAAFHPAPLHRGHRRCCYGERGTCGRRASVLTTSCGRPLSVVGRSWAELARGPTGNPMRWSMPTVGSVAWRTCVLWTCR